jgi:hypothetical protein
MTERKYGLAPQIRLIADLTPANLRVLMEDMGTGPGWYTSVDLYRWYESMAREDKMEPVSQRKFGAVLRELGYKSAIRRVDGKSARSWFITRRALRGGARPGDRGPDAQ